MKNYVFLFQQLSIPAFNLSDMLNSLRRLFMPQPVPVPMVLKHGRHFVFIATLGCLPILASSCSKKKNTDSTGSDRISLSSHPTNTTSKSNSSGGGASPLGQQMLAQKIVEDISGGTDIRAGRRAADKIDAVNASRKADFEEMEK
jgi:hypothetical protein